MTLEGSKQHEYLLCSFLFIYMHSCSFMCNFVLCWLFHVDSAQRSFIHLTYWIFLSLLFACGSLYSSLQRVCFGIIYKGLRTASRSVDYLQPMLKKKKPLWNLSLLDFEICSLWWPTLPASPTPWWLKWLDFAPCPAVVVWYLMLNTMALIQILRVVIGSVCHVLLYHRCPTWFHLVSSDF